ncbi:MAG: hypothetical protein JJ863_08190 [Deltaproteobacteria bacterium]|nr:hypothetical protein [Deltaproteobacteria bacterium]
MRLPIIAGFMLFACGPTELAFDETGDLDARNRSYVAEKLAIACDGGRQISAPAFEPGSHPPVALVTNSGSGGIPRWMPDNTFELAPSTLSEAPLVACVDRSSDPSRIRIVVARTGEVVAETEASTPSYASHDDKKTAVRTAVQAAVAAL